MNFNDYQIEASTYRVYPEVGNNLNYPLKGLFSEVGEVADKLKKLERDYDITSVKQMNTTDISDLSKELGDVLWYISAMATELNLKLEDIANNNLEKLSSRKKRNKLNGSGDNR